MDHTELDKKLIERTRDTRFKPGAEWRGNPGGRPPKRPQSEANDALLRMPASAEVVVALREFGLKPGATVADVVAVCLYREALKGNVQAAKELRESVEGKSVARVELLTQEEKTIELAVVFDNVPDSVRDRLLPASQRVIDVEDDTPDTDNPDTP
jgi:hypothetical protein